MAEREIVRGMATLGSRPINPPAAGWNHGAPQQLALWLLLASDAQETPSPAAAIRFYSVILEDISDFSHPLATTEAFVLAEVKAVRDSVSHPVITSRKTKALLDSCAPKLADGFGEYRQDPAFRRRNRDY
jgi:hypothetical protein